LAVFLAVMGFAGAAPARAALQDENLLVSMPQGFKVGSSTRQGNMDMQEWVPVGETVDNWSTLITVQIFHHLTAVTPQAFVGRIATGWKSACPGGAAIDVQEGVENGYGYSFWTLTCPLNPQTRKPENMWTKVMAGSDALYSVQYANRKTLAKELTVATARYLRQVQVCDTRRPDRRCPPGM
jgi:hypothetical protein